MTPLKARSTTGRVCPEHVSGVCLMAMAAAPEAAGGGRGAGERRRGARTEPGKGHESPPAGQEAAVSAAAAGGEMTARKRFGAEVASGGGAQPEARLGAGARRDGRDP